MMNVTERFYSSSTIPKVMGERRSWLILCASFSITDRNIVYEQSPADSRFLVAVTLGSDVNIATERNKKENDQMGQVAKHILFFILLSAQYSFAQMKLSSEQDHRVCR